MLKMIHFLALCFFAQGLFAQTMDKTLLGVLIPHTINIHNPSQQLQLNGAAVQSLMGTDGYVAALYVQQQSSNPNIILLNDSPTVMKFYWVKDDMTPEQLKQIFSEMIMQNNADLGKSIYDLQRYKDFLAAFKRNINAGDVMNIQYMSVNQKIVLTLNNNELQRWTKAKTFFNRILKMWLGEHPPSRQFKEEILGEVKIS